LRSNFRHTDQKKCKDSVVLVDYSQDVVEITTFLTGWNTDSIGSNEQVGWGKL